MKEKKLIIFDFFNVISCEIAPFWFRKFFNDDEADKYKAEYVGPADDGSITDEEMFKNLSVLTGEPWEKIRDDWFDMVVIDEKMVGLIKKLKERYRIVLLSNAPLNFLDTILDKYNLRVLFDGIVISANFGNVKPRPEIYREALRIGGENAEDAIMTDDNPKNITGAKNVGIDGIVFTGYEDFVEELQKYGVKPDF